MKLCKQQAEIVQNHENANVCDVGQGKSQHTKYKRLNLAPIKHTTCKQQAEIVQNHENANVCDVGQGKSQHTKYKRLKLGPHQAYDCSHV
jgi:hypothetical protein